MAKLYNIEGFPFANASAEEERKYLGDIFYEQQYYPELLELAEASASRFILGQRGQGKSATILHLLEDMKQQNILPILIDQYDGFPEKENKKYFLHIMIRSLTFALAEEIMEKPRLRRKLDSTQKRQFGLYIEMFYDQITATNCVNNANAIRNKRKKNKFKQIYNWSIRLIKGLIHVTNQITPKLILKKLQLESLSISEVGREYLPELELESYQQVPRSIIITWETPVLKQMLVNLISMAIAIGHPSVVVMFDKIDEIAHLNGQIDKVTNFMMDFLTDTNLLYTDNLSIIVGLWSEIKKSLNKQGVRFDKFKEVDIRWTDDELIRLLNKRLHYFSKDKMTPITFCNLVPDALDRNLILKLADKSPRALLNLIGKIVDEESNENSIEQFSKDAMSRGLKKYCKTFDYLSVQPTKTGKGNDVLIWISRLLRQKLVEFSFKQYAENNHISQKTAKNHIENLLRYNLIRDTMEGQENDDPIYVVADPRISFLISRGEQSLE